MDRQVVALLCRTSDRAGDGAAGTRELAELLDARIVGSPGEPRTAGWSDDLRDARGCLLEAGGQLDDALDAGRVPILLAPECSIAVSTLPVLIRRHPDARVLWLDAHADFHTPQTTTSGYLGGMCLAGACGLWDTGFGAGVDPPRVIMHGVREVEGPERVGLDRGGVYLIEDPGQLDGFEVFVHLDLDVLDPDVFPAQFPVDGGLEPGELREFLAEVCAACTLLGAEITSAAPGHGDSSPTRSPRCLAERIHPAAASGFARAADAYERGRPGYRDDAVDWLASFLASPVVDLAAGTGLLSRALAARGFEVVAVEPVAEMRALVGDGVRVLGGTAEQIRSPTRAPRASPSRRRFTGSTARARSPRSPECCAPAACSRSSSTAAGWRMRSNVASTSC